MAKKNGKKENAVKKVSVKAKIIGFLVGIQCVLLCALLFGVLRPKNTLDVPLSGFLLQGAENLYADGTSVVFQPMKGISDDNWQTVGGEAFSLPSGGYQIEVTYSVDAAGSKNVLNVPANVTIKGRHESIDSSILNLDEAHSTAVGRVWIPMFSEYDDLRIEVWYNGTSVVEVKQCKLVECIRYRFMRILGYMVLFFLMDCFVCYVMEYPFKVPGAWVVLVGIAFVASIPFIATALHTGHDLDFHLIRIIALADEFSNGQFPVRMATNLNNGYGYANPIYYGDIFLYLPALLYLCMVPLRTCYQIYVLLVNAFTCVTTYYTLSRFTQDRNIRLLGVALYELCTYRLVNINIRAAVGEYTAMCFLPLVILGLYNIYSKEKQEFKDWLPLSLGMAGIILCHVLTAEMVSINIALFCIVMLKKTLKKDRILSLCKAVGLCVALTFWFLLPFVDCILHQKTLVEFDILSLPGGSAQPLGRIFRLLPSGKIFENYLTIGLSLIAGMVIVLYCIFSKRKNDREISWQTLCFIYGFSLLDLFFCSKLFPWDNIQTLFGLEGMGRFIGTIQFAWRYLTLASVLLTFSIVVAMEYLKTDKKNLYWPGFIVLIACIVINTGCFYYQCYTRIAYSVYGAENNYANTDDLYLLAREQLTTRNVSECKIVEGDAVVRDYQKNGGAGYLTVKNDSDKEAKVSIPIFAYYHYKVYAQEENAAAGMKEILFENDDNKCILAEVPANYDGKIIVRFVEPASWRLAEVVSLLALIFTGGRCIQIWRKDWKDREIDGLGMG